MSVLNKKPYVKTVLEALSKDYLQQLQLIIDETLSPENAYFMKLRFNKSMFLNDFASQPHYVHLYLDKALNEIVLGYLVCIDDNTAVCFGTTQDEDMDIIVLDLNNVTFSVVNESLDINEFRRELANLTLSGHSGSGISEMEMFKTMALSDNILNGTPVDVSDWGEDTLNEINNLCNKITGEEN